MKVCKKHVIVCIFLINLSLLFFPALIHADPLDNWATVATSTDDWFYGITYGTDKFVTVGAFGTVLTSPDGVGWTAQTTPITNHLYGVGFGNNTYVAVGTVGKIITSPDSITWTSRTEGQAHPVSQNLYGVAYGSGKFVVVGGHGTILTSTDNGATWVDPFWPFASVTADWLYDVVYDNSTFIDVGAYGTILSSANGGSWSVETSPTSLHLSGVAYGNGTFVAVGEGGIILSSPDGVTWYQEHPQDPPPPDPPTTDWLRGITFAYGNFVAVGDNGTIITSPDGTNWTLRHWDDSYYLEDVAYGNNVFVTVGGQGTIVSSSALIAKDAGKDTSVSGSTVSAAGESSTTGIILRTFTGAIVINEGAAYTNSTSATLTLSCDEFSSSGCTQMQFSDDMVTWSAPEAFSPTKAWTLPSGDGGKTVYVKFKDTAENWSSPYSDTIILDTAAPTANASPGGGTYFSSQSVTLTCADGSGSGCNRIYYTIDGSTPTTSSTVYSDPISIASNTILKFFAEDYAGNPSSVGTETYVFGPSLAITTTSLASGIIDVSYSDTIIAIGGFPPYTWSIISGILPGNLSLNSSTGEISGIPTITGTFNFTVQVTDTWPSSVTKPLAITIEPSPGVRNENAPSEIFNTIQDVYNAAGDGDTIQALATTFTESLNFNRNILVTLMGGFNSDFTSNNSFTTVNGTVTISDGTVVMENIIIQ